MNTASLTPFNGSDYSHDRDAPRLTDQMKRVFEVLSTNQWVTLADIAAATGDPTPSISAQIRHLRKVRFGSHEIEKAYHGNGLFAYRLTGEKIWHEHDKQEEEDGSLPPAAPELLEAAQLENTRLKALLDEASQYLDYRLLSAFCNDDLPDRIAAAIHSQISTQSS